MTADPRETRLREIAQVKLRARELEAERNAILRELAAELGAGASPSWRASPASPVRVWAASSAPTAVAMTRGPGEPVVLPSAAGSPGPRLSSTWPGSPQAAVHIDRARSADRQRPAEIFHPAQPGQRSADRRDHAAENCELTKASWRCTAARRWLAVDPLEGPLLVVIKAFMPIASTGHGRRLQAALAGEIRPGKPDLDNIMKTLDALNGICFRDDAQVAEAWIAKYYAENPRLEIEISPPRPPCRARPHPAPPGHAAPNLAEPRPPRLAAPSHAEPSLAPTASPRPDMPCRAAPHRTEPRRDRLAQPGLAQPHLAMPGRDRRAEPYLAPPSHTQPGPAEPYLVIPSLDRRAKPSQAMPRRALPSRTWPRPPCHTSQRQTACCHDRHAAPDLI